MSNLRVLFVSHAYVVGVNQGKLNAIAQTNQAEVGLLAPSNWKALEWNRFLPLEMSYPQIKIYSGTVQFAGKVGAYFYKQSKLPQVIKDFQPDIIQGEVEVFSICALQLAIWSRIKRKPLVLFGWENMNRQLPLPRLWLRRFVLNTAKLVIAGNRDGANLLRQWGYTGIIEVMPQLGVDTQLFTPQIRLLEANNEFRIGFLGRLVPEKGVDIIFTAVRRLKDKGINCRIVICGSGSQEQALREEAQKQQIGDLITWRGGVSHEQAPVEISKFDVLVLPSRTASTWKEQFGHVLIEAMAMGVPVIGSSSGEIPNVIGRSDLIFPEGNADKLAAILQRMIQEPQWREEVGKYGINRVHKYYSHERIAQRLMKLWQTLLHSKDKQHDTKADGFNNVVSVRE